MTAMTERERWIVYPLLFLALGAALRDKLKERTISKSIYCQELVVVDEDLAGQRPTRILARFGRSETAGGGASRGHLVVNGGVSVVDADDLGAHDSFPVLAKMGRADLPPAGRPASGLLIVEGVDGVVSAPNYAYRGVPIVPAFRPGVSLESVLRAVQQAVGRGSNPNANDFEQPATDAASSAGGSDDADQADDDPRQRPVRERQP